MSKQPIPLYSEKNLTALADSALDGQIADYARKIDHVLAERQKALDSVADCERNAVLAAWQLGNCLEEKKRRLPYGHFTDWCLAFSARTGVSGRSLRDYMRLARHFGSAANLRPSIRESLRSIPSEPSTPTRHFGSAANLRPSIRESLRSIPSEPSTPRRDPTTQERAIEAPETSEPRPVVQETALAGSEPRSVDESEPATAPTGDPVTHSVAKAQPHVVRGDSDVEWYTSATIIDAARAVMGGIDLDPASCAHAQAAVRASRYFDAAANGLVQEWAGRVWLNLPYARGLVNEFVNKIVASPAVTHAIVLANNATETQWGAVLLQASAAVCFPTGRVHFDQGDSLSTGAPVQGQMLVGMGPELDRNAFIERFGMFGPVFIRPQGDTT